MIALDAVSRVASSALVAALFLAPISRAAPPPITFVGPWLQEVREGGYLLSFETDPAAAARVLLQPPGAPPRTLESPAALHHDVPVDHLLPGRTAYRIVLGSDETAGTPGTPGIAGSGSIPSAPPTDRYTFLVYGDNRDRDEDHRRVVAAMRKEPADFVLHTGDLTGDAAEEFLWRRFFAIEAPLLATTPILPALGNHEFLHDPTAAHFHHYFRLPDGAAPAESAGEGPRWYRIRLGNALFIALDGTHSRDPAEHAFLESALTMADGDARIRHVFVFFHQPPFAVGDMCGSATEQGLWVPEFAHHHVRAVFAGHDHAYEHLERNGVRYFVTGGGGAPLHQKSAVCPAYDRDALRTFASVHHFLRVKVRGDEAVLDAIGVDGQVLDSVRLHEPAPSAPGPPAPVPWLDPPAHGEDAASALSAGPWTWKSLGKELFAIGFVIFLLVLRVRSWRRAERSQGP